MGVGGVGWPGCGWAVKNMGGLGWMAVLLDCFVPHAWRVASQKDLCWAHVSALALPHSALR